jgi:hypothetical protein
MTPFPLTPALALAAMACEFPSGRLVPRRPEPVDPVKARKAAARKARQRAARKARKATRRQG